MKTIQNSDLSKESLSSVFLKVKCPRTENDMVYLAQPQHLQAPNKIMEYGKYVATRFSEGWFTAKPGGSGISKELDQAIIQKYESTPYAITPTPPAVLRAQNPTERAKIAYNMGIWEHECESWGVDKAILSSIESKYQGAHCPLNEGFRPKSDEDKQRENAAIVGLGGMTYGQWKGETGAGLQLKQILAAQKKDSGPQM